jgi:hypothetical protein
VNFTPQEKERIRLLVANAKSPQEIEDIERSVKRGVLPKGAEISNDVTMTATVATDDSTIVTDTVVDSTSNDVTTHAAVDSTTAVTALDSTTNDATTPNAEVDSTTNDDAVDSTTNDATTDVAVDSTTKMTAVDSTTNDATLNAEVDSTTNDATTDATVDSTTNDATADATPIADEHTTAVVVVETPSRATRNVGRRKRPPPEEEKEEGTGEETVTKLSDAAVAPPTRPKRARKAKK